MAGRVAGKGIVITGAGSGMGRAFALALAKEGATVGVLDRDEGAAEQVRAAIDAEPSGGGKPAIALTADVSNRA